MKSIFKGFDEIKGFLQISHSFIAAQKDVMRTGPPQAIVGDNSISDSFLFQEGRNLLEAVGRIISPEVSIKEVIPQLQGLPAGIYSRQIDDLAGIN